MIGAGSGWRRLTISFARTSSAGDPFMAEGICLGVCRTDNKALATLLAVHIQKTDLHNRVLMAKLGQRK